MNYLKLMSLEELGQEYASITIRQETGKDLFGNSAERYQPNDAESLSFIENKFAEVDNPSLPSYIECAFEIQQESI